MKLMDYFKENEDAFIEAIEELDSYNGYLGDDRYYEMELLNEFYAETDPLDILYRAFYGHDEDTSTEECHTEFNPNRTYFRYNGYGNLVSTDYKDYSDRLDDWFIQSLKDNYMHLYLSDETKEAIENDEADDDEADF